jgi:hypothetical protein
MMTIVNIFLSVVLDTYSKVNDKAEGGDKEEKEKIAVTQVVPMQTNADPMAEVGDRLREARQMYGAGSEEYKTAVEEAKKTKESMVASKDVV